MQASDYKGQEHRQSTPPHPRGDPRVHDEVPQPRQAGRGAGLRQREHTHSCGRLGATRAVFLMGRRVVGWYRVRGVGISRKKKLIGAIFRKFNESANNFRTHIFFIIVRCEFREMGTPEARSLISVRCDFTIYLFLEGGPEISVRWVPRRPETQLV